MDKFQLWACEENALRAYLDAVQAAEMAARNGVKYSAEKTPDILDIQGDTAYVEISGMLTPNGPSPLARLFGIQGASYKEIQGVAELVAGDESIKRVVLNMDTPGGTVAGVEDTYAAIAALSEKKEVVAVNQGMIASAGYWLALATRRM